MKFTEFIKRHVSGIHLVSLGVLASLLTGGLHGKLLLGGGREVGKERVVGQAVLCTYCLYPLWHCKSRLRRGKI